MWQDWMMLSLALIGILSWLVRLAIAAPDPAASVAPADQPPKFIVLGCFMVLCFLLFSVSAAAVFETVGGPSVADVLLFQGLHFLAAGAYALLAVFERKPLN